MYALSGPVAFIVLATPAFILRCRTGAVLERLCFGWPRALNALFLLLVSFDLAGWPGGSAGLWIAFLAIPLLCVPVIVWAGTELREAGIANGFRFIRWEWIDSCEWNDSSTLELSGEGFRIVLPLPQGKRESTLRMIAERLSPGTFTPGPGR